MEIVQIFWPISPRALITGNCQHLPIEFSLSTLCPSTIPKVYERKKRGLKKRTWRVENKWFLFIFQIILIFMESPGFFPKRFFFFFWLITKNETFYFLLFNQVGNEKQMKTKNDSWNKKKPSLCSNTNYHKGLYFSQNQKWTKCRRLISSFASELR